MTLSYIPFVGYMLVKLASFGFTAERVSPLDACVNMTIAHAALVLWCLNLSYWLAGLMEWYDARRASAIYVGTFLALFSLALASAVTGLVRGDLWETLHSTRAVALALLLVGAFGQATMFNRTDQETTTYRVAPPYSLFLTYGFFKLVVFLSAPADPAGRAGQACLEHDLPLLVLAETVVLFATCTTSWVGSRFGKPATSVAHVLWFLTLAGAFMSVVFSVGHTGPTGTLQDVRDSVLVRMLGILIADNIISFLASGSTRTKSE